VALGAFNVPNVAFGALNAPNAPNGALWRQLTRLDETVFAGAGAGLETGGSAERGHEFRHPEAVGAAETGFVETIGDVLLVRGEQELFNRTANLFKRAGEVACTANDLYTWASARRRLEIAPDHAEGKRIRKIYRPGVLLDPSASAHVREIQRTGAGIRITSDELNETIILDRRIAIMAGDNAGGMRSYNVITRPELVQGVSSLFEAAWRAATDLARYDTRLDETRRLTPQILDFLASGCKDETAARTLGLGLRTYRRRVAELMAALGATSRFQAGARAREQGLI
jgi:DNA-binding NarL/FixJ family response regulator